MQGEDDAQTHNLLRRKAKSGGLRFLVGYQEEAENKHSEVVEAHSNDLASYSESNNENLRPDHSHNNYNLYGLERNMSIGNETKTPINNSSTGYKPSKRKAEESKNLLAVQSERNTVQDPRIVRVNRASGGKDRHSKVRTSKGLRDRRVRLSVSTAIQFYDLQDRLGFEQPSKAVDWLINKAKSAIDELPVLETDTAGAVCNLSQTLASSNCSPANVSAAAAPGVFAAHLGGSSAESAQFSQKGEETANAAQILNQGSVAFRQSDVGRLSSSSTSDGSIKGGDTSHSSLSKSATRGKTRLKEARERAKRKSASAKDTGPHPQQLNQVRSSFAELLNNVVSYSTQLPAQDKPQCSPGDHHNHNSYGLPNQVSSSSSNIHQPWDTVSSYTDILCQDAADQRDRQQQLHLIASLCSSHAAMEHSSPPSSSVAAVGNTYLRRYNEMGNSGIQLFNAPNLKQRHHQLGGNVVQFQAINLYSDPMRSFGKNDMVESQELQHGSQTVQKQFASTLNVPAFSNDVNFSTSCLFSRGALQSNSSSVHPDTPSLHINPKNAYGDASTQLHFDVPPGETHHFQGFDAQFPERFQQGFNFEGESTKHEQSYISVPRRR